MTTGHDFGTTPFGANLHEPTRKPGCICEPEFIAIGITDIRCPVDGLAAFMRDAFGVETK